MFSWQRLRVLLVLVGFVAYATGCVESASKSLQINCADEIGIHGSMTTLSKLLDETGFTRLPISQEMKQRHHVADYFERQFPEDRIKTLVQFQYIDAKSIRMFLLQIPAEELSAPANEQFNLLVDELLRENNCAIEVG